MDEDLPAVLLIGGGEGMGPIEATARALGDSLYDENVGAPAGQILVICGRNKKLLNKLNSIDWKVPVQVLLPLKYFLRTLLIIFYSNINYNIFCSFIALSLQSLVFPA